MIKQYIKQAWRALKENPVMSTIAILGTALAICMIMVMVMMHQVKNAPFPPEINRDRTLYIKWMSTSYKDGSGGGSNSAVGTKYATEVFKSLKSAEDVAIASYIPNPVIVSEAGKKKGKSYDIRVVDEGFWRVFQFDFIDGEPFNKADVDAGLKKAVISESIARNTYGRTDVSGERIMLNYAEYEVQGVVKDVSTLFTSAYSQIWVPLYAQAIPGDNNEEGILGVSNVFILAHSQKDFDKIRAEIEENRLKYNAATEYSEAFYRGQPDDHFTFINRLSSNKSPNINGVKKQAMITLLLLLIVPAINLSGITNSMMRKRLSELGLRRAFGAPKRLIMSQVFFESLVQTLIGGLIGLILCYGAAYLLKSIFLKTYMMTFSSGNLSIDIFSLITPTIFLSALLFCLLLNLISALLPAWKVSRVPIVESLQTK